MTLVRGRARPETSVGAARRQLRHRRGRGGRHHRAQRRRQEHAAEDPLADHGADRGRRRASAGRVGSLLEVGTGFHPELTGRENVFLNGAILGMRRAEITRKFDEIVALRRGRSVPRHARQALLERHVHAPGVRGGRAPRAGDPDRRRGAGGGRRRVSEEVPRQDGRRRASRGARCCSSATTSGPFVPSVRAASCSPAGRCSSTAAWKRPSRVTCRARRTAASRTARSASGRMAWRSTSSRCCRCASATRRGRCGRCSMRLSRSRSTSSTR